MLRFIAETLTDYGRYTVIITGEKSRCFGVFSQHLGSICCTRRAMVLVLSRQSTGLQQDQEKWTNIGAWCSYQQCV